MHAPFIHLCVHSAYSLAESAIKIPDLVARCQQERIPAVALTDSGNLFGALEFSKAASSAGIQPIIGCQIQLDFLDDDPRQRETPSLGKADSRDKLILLVQNQKGYANLIKLVSQSYLRYPHHPHVAFSWLHTHHEGLIALSGGMAGGAARLLQKGDPAYARQWLQTLSRLFPDRFYVELTRHGWPDQQESAIEEDMLALAYDLNLPLVATNEAFFLDRSLYEAHDALLCIASGTYVSQLDRRRVTPNHCFRSAQEMIDLFRDIPEAISNTLVIAQRCGFMVEPRDPLLPPFPAHRPEPEELAAQAREGLEKRLTQQVFSSSASGESPLSQDEKNHNRRLYEERLEQEIQIIARMGYAGYYLIVSDFIKWAKSQNIPVGPGRGSGAGSLVAWALTITDIDPIRFGLLFERFLNPERVSMPDFDVDFCQERRDEVIAYVKDKYGADHVAQIITFGKLQARAVLRDVGRVLGMPYGQVDRLSKMIPHNPAQPITLKQAFTQDPQLQSMAREEPTVQHLFNLAMKLEGLYRHASIHAAGIVIGDRPLDELVPLHHDGKNPLPATQFNMKDVETAGLVKLDFLGLKTLTIIQKTVIFLKHRGISLDISTIPLDDPTTFEKLRHLETVGIFQIEGAGMRDVLRRMQPNRFEELIALVALYRPGPMDDIPRYLACKHGQEPVQYGHPLLEQILKETYGVMVYQEQVMQIAQVMGGYTLGGADLLRRAMGKKIKSEMDAQREIFVSGAQKNGVDKRVASHIFDQMAKFAGYGFNKCHSAPYALITYQTAYLKANFPVEFMAATMTYDMANTDKLTVYREELVRLGIPLLMPDINQSGSDFLVEHQDDGTQAIRYALAAIKNVGEASIKALEKERAQHGPFQNIIDFVRRLDSKSINKRLLENLICAGAFDKLHPNRAQLFHSADKILKYLGENQNTTQARQKSIFFEEESTDFDVQTALTPAPSWPLLEELQKEWDAVGFYLSSHPLQAYGKSLERLRLTSSAQVQELALDQNAMDLKMAGVVLSKKERLSKNGSRFAFVTFSDASGVFEVAIFSEHYLPYRDTLEAGAVFFLRVMGRCEGETRRLTVNSLTPLETLLQEHPCCLQLHIQDAQALEPLKEIVSKAQKGNGRLDVVVTRQQGQKILVTLPTRILITPDIRHSLYHMPGIQEVREI